MSNTNVKLFYANAQTLNSHKKVVVHLIVNENRIIKPRTLKNYENATFLTKRIIKVIKIIDKNGNIYKTAEDIYTDELYQFTLNRGLISDNFIKIYQNEKVCISKQSENKIKKITLYHRNGNIFMDGISINGIFSGKKYNENNTTCITYKDGIVINSKDEIENIDTNDNKNELNKNLDNTPICATYKDGIVINSKDEIENVDTNDNKNANDEDNCDNFTNLNE